MPRVPALLAALLLVAPVAGAQETPDSAEGAATPDAPASATSTTLPAAPVVTLLDPGKGRARPLRYQPAAGDAFQLQLHRRSATTAQVDDEPEEAQSAPPATTVLDARVGAALTLTLADADLADVGVEALAMLRAELAALAGTPLVLDLSPTGGAAPVVPNEDEVTSPLAQELLSDTQWALTLLSTPLPDEPVGKGARWSWSRPALEQGVQVDQRFTATLLERRRDRAVLGITLEMTAVEGGTEMDVTFDAFAAAGTATCWLDLSRPLPTAARLELKGQLHGGWEDDGPHRLHGTFTVSLALASRPVDSPAVDADQTGG